MCQMIEESLLRNQAGHEGMKVQSKPVSVSGDATLDFAPSK